MTVETQTNFITYAGDGTALTFPFGFPVYDASHLTAFVVTTATGVIVTTYNPGDYTVSGIGDSSGGSVTLPVAPIAGQTFVLSRQVPLTQDLNILNQGGFYPEAVQDELDLLEMQIQQISESVSRSLTVPLGETFNGALGTKTARALKVVSFDANGALDLANQSDFVTASITTDILYDLFGSVLVAGAGMGIVYDPTGKTITFSAPGAGLTTQDMKNTMATTLAAGSGIAIALGVSNDPITLSADAEFIRDTIGATIVAGIGVDVVVSDVGNTITISAPEEWAPNFTAAGDLYIPAAVAMTISQGNAVIGTGTLTYAKSTTTAPGTFTTTTLPATLQTGAWLKVSASAVTGFVATHLVRTA